MEWGIAINLRESVGEVVEKAVLAERGGIDTIWLTDYPAVRLSPLLASAVAQNTKRCRIGVGLLSPLIYSTSQIVRYMRTLIELYGNRFDLLLGPGDKTKLKNIGVDYGDITSLVQRMKTMASEIHQELSEYSECRIFFAAQGSKMLRASTCVDGVLLNYADLDMIQWAITNIHDRMKGFRVGIFPPALISSSTKCDNDISIRTSAAVVALGMNTSLLNHFGLTKYVEPAKLALKREGKLSPIVTDLIEQKILDRFCISGPSEKLCEYLSQLEELGVDIIVFGPPQGATYSGVECINHARIQCI